MSDTAYVLITAARNEEASIGLTIEAVVAQTMLPRRWIIVSDASTDGTDAIIQRYAAQHDFIRLLRRDHAEGRNFGSKVHAINEAIERLAGESYDYIGILDADVTFQPDYFERLLQEFQTRPQLGIAGGLLFDYYDGAPHKRYASLDSVSGAVQLFRRACYEAVGGYTPLPGGSEDALALHMARWKGFETRSFPELPVMHLRKTGTVAWSIWRTRFNQGVMQGRFGWSPSFVLLRAAYRSIERPYILGALVRTLGFCWASLSRARHPLPDDLVRFIRAEQCRKLRNLLFGRWRPWRA